MGCGSCGTTTGTSPGCKNNGTCGTDGCNKLNVYNWLSDMELPAGQRQYEIVEVRFKGSRKEFYRNQDNIDVKTGDIVAVEASPGHDIGTVSMVGELVRLQLKKKHFTERSVEIRTLYRVARPSDIEKWEAVKALEVNSMYRARVIAIALGLEMKLSDVEYQGDGKKATFYYTADERVDFRELIKRLADEFKIRVEMRQIGMRQEASRLGGIGSCGRELCCSTWLTDFKAVTTGAARYQNLSLNPVKLAGQCGKLKCCLNYELDSYLDALKDIPDSSINLHTTKGVAMHQKTDIFKKLLWYSYKSIERKEEEGSDTWVVLPASRVKEIIEMNKANEKPEELRDANMEEIELPDDNYADVVGQDSLTRMDNKRKKKKKKKRPGNEQQNRPQQQQQNRPQQQQNRPQQQQNRPQQQQNRPQQQQNRPQQQQGTQQPAPKPAQPQQKPEPDQQPNRPPRQRNVPR